MIHCNFSKIILYTILINFFYSPQYAISALSKMSPYRSPKLYPKAVTSSSTLKSAKAKPSHTDVCFSFTVAQQTATLKSVGEVHKGIISRTKKDGA